MFTEKCLTQNNEAPRTVIMFKLQQKRKEEAEKKARETTSPPSLSKQMSVRSRFLTREVSEIQSCMPKTCSVSFGDVDDLRRFTLYISPEEGYWKGGKFTFEIEIPPEYNIKPPKVVCLTKLWHPNITEDGKICLSILREHTMDGTGWLPTRTLKDVIWGLNALFTDLCDFEDPLNVPAAEQHNINRRAFERKVRDYVRSYAVE